MSPCCARVESERPSYRSLALLVIVSAVFLALVVHAISAQRGEPKYVMVDELVERGLDEYRDRPLEVHGWVVPGTIVRHDGGATFSLVKNGRRLRVRADGPLPDTFCDGREVIAVGELRGDVLEACDVLAKCPSKYEGTRDKPCGRGVMLVE